MSHDIWARAHVQLSVGKNYPKITSSLSTIQPNAEYCRKWIQCRKSIKWGRLVAICMLHKGKTMLLAGKQNLQPYIKPLANDKNHITLQTATNSWGNNCNIYIQSLKTNCWIEGTVGNTFIYKESVTFKLNILLIFSFYGEIYGISTYNLEHQWTF